MAQIFSKKCALCSQVDGKYFCYECGYALCDLCQEKHNKIPSAARHKLTSLQQVDLSSFNTRSICTNHKVEFVLCCKTCNCLICCKCVTSTHADHKFSDIETVVSSERRDALETVADLKSKMETLLDLKKKVCDYLKNLRIHSEKVSKDIEETFKDLSVSIECQQKKWEREVEIFEGQQLNELDTFINHVDLVLEKTKQLCMEIDNLLAEKDNKAFHLRYKTLKLDVDSLENIPEEPDLKDRPIVNAKMILKDMMDVINSKFAERLCVKCKEQDREFCQLMKERDKNKKKIQRLTKKMEKQFKADTESIKKINEEQLKTKENLELTEEIYQKAKDENQQKENELESLKKEFRLAKKRSTQVQSLSPYPEELVPGRMPSSPVNPHIKLIIKSESVSTGSILETFKGILTEIITKGGSLEKAMRPIVNIVDERSIHGIVEMLFDECVTNHRFRNAGALTVMYLSTQLINSSKHSNFMILFLKRCKEEYLKREALIFYPETVSRLCGYTLFMGELFLRMAEETGNNQMEQLAVTRLMIRDLLLLLLKHPKDQTIRCVAALLKKAGKTIEATAHLNKPDEGDYSQIFTHLTELASCKDLKRESRQKIGSVLRLRAANWVLGDGSSYKSNP